MSTRVFDLGYNREVRKRMLNLVVFINIVLMSVLSAVRTRLGGKLISEAVTKFV